jgi:hypothetical protein
MTVLADYVVPLALRAVCELRVADHLAAGPRPVEELAAATGAHAPSLRRALRALACKGIFTEVSPGRFGLTPMAQLLRGDHPLSVRDAYPLLPADLAAWSRVDHTLRTGQAAFPHAHGVAYYDHLATDPDASARFDRSVHAQNRLVLRTLLSAYDWAGCGTIVDVAAGNGAFLAGLLARFRSLRGVVFDLPHVVAGAPAVLESAGVAERCVIVPGNVFDTVPAGGDTYLLKTILHDWDDERAGAILRGIAGVMPSRGKLIVLEALLPDGDQFHIGKLLDLHSLVTVAGPDRGLAELESLFTAADLALSRVVHTPSLAIMEVRHAAH